MGADDQSGRRGKQSARSGQPVSPGGDRGWLEVLAGLSHGAEPPPAADRRAQPRTRVAVPVAAARLPGPEEGANTALRFVSGMSRDVGSGGLSFTCPGVHVAPGDLVSLFLAPPGAGRRLHATCVVLRVSGPWVAARFVDLDERAQLELTRFVRRYGQRWSAMDAAGEAWGVDDRDER